MCGVNFKLENGYLDIVGTNGHVIVRSRYSCAGMVSTNRIGSFIMPNKVANILSSIVESDADFGWNDSEACIHLLQCDITFRLIEGKYPNYNSVFPQDLSELKEASADRSLMMNSIRKVMPFASESSGTKMLHLSLDYGKLTIAGQNVDYFAGATDTITAGYVGEPVEIGANGQYLHNMIKNLSGLHCKIKLTDATHPIVIEPNEQEDNCEVSMLLMPMLLDK
jgi:DNA polymerase-3 subunit beta